MFKKIRSRLHHYLLRKKLEKNNQQRQTINFLQAKTIAVVFDATLPENVASAKRFQERLSEANKRVRFFAYINHDKPAGSLPFEYMTRRQVNGLFIPKHPGAEDVLVKKYDLLINLCAMECLPLEYICALSNASFRVGRFIPDKTYCYDFMIQMGDRKDMDYLCEQIYAYLKMIK